MSLKVEPTELQAIPEETVRVARAAFPRGSRAMRLRDELGTVYADDAFAPLFAVRGRPAEAPWRLALVRCCSSRRTSPTARRPTRCGAGSTGSTCVRHEVALCEWGEDERLPQASVPGLFPIPACVTGNGGVRSQG